MIRKIIRIDESKCNGCGACASACHEGAIAIEEGKARLMREDYCDGLGDCLPACPTGAITFEEREAPAYDHGAVMAAKAEAAARPDTEKYGQAPGTLFNWPVQIKLAPLQSPYFDGAKLLIAADCTAYAYASIHRDFMSGRVTLIGCPKLDEVDYSQKLEQMISANHIRSITLVRMEVPCCGGIEAAAKRAVQRSGKSLPVQVVIISTDGRILK